MFDKTNVNPGDRLICTILDEIIHCTVTEIEEDRFWAIWDDDGKPANSSYYKIVCKESKLHKALK